MKGTGSKAAHPLFGDGNIPKNKDVNGFTKDISQITPLEKYMKHKFHRSAQKEGFKTVKDIPEDFTFGKIVDRNHDMLALLTN